MEKKSTQQIPKEEKIIFFQCGFIKVTIKGCPNWLVVFIIIAAASIAILALLVAGKIRPPIF